MEIDQLIGRYPHLYHMCEKGSWESIRDRGLLSTSAVLDFFALEAAERFEYESAHRAEKRVVGQGTDGQIMLRDQKPMEPSRLERALIDGTTPQQWYELINSKVFFWVSEDRLFGLLNARPYRSLEHDVLTVDTDQLVRKYRESIWLCHMNSGNTFPVPHLRGVDAFKRIPDYPAKASGMPRKEVVELVVDYAVLDISQFVLKVRRMKGREVLGSIAI